MNMKLTIRAKLLGAFASLIVLLLIVSTITILSISSLQNKFIALRDVTLRIGEFSESSRSDMLQARRSEKDYLLRYKELGFEEAHATYVTDVQTSVADLRQNMRDLRGLTRNADLLAAAGKIEQEITMYETTFLRVVSLIEQRGYLDAGLEGAFRAKVHTLEDLVTQKGLDRLTIDILTLRRHEKDYLLRGDPAYVTRLHDTVTQFKADVSAAEVTSSEAQSLSAGVDEYQAAFDQLVQIDQQIAANTQTYRDAAHELEPVLDQILTISNADETTARDDLIRTGQVANSLTVGVTLAATALGLFLAFIISRAISNSARQMVRAAEQIAQVDLVSLTTSAMALANGDLLTQFAVQAQPVNDAGSDEMGDLARAFNQMIAQLQAAGNAFSEMLLNMRHLVGQVAENANAVQEASAQLASSTTQSSLAVNQIASTVQQVAQGTSQQSTSIAKIATAVEQMSRTIQGVAKGSQEQATAIARSATLTGQITTTTERVAANAQGGAKGAAAAAQTARTGVKTVEDTIHGMAAIKARVGASAQKVQEMGQRSNQIGAIVETIDDIASQTNLLALNAAIEAARAGEHGKGFAVVADEVRKLAEKSATATKEIAGLIKNIQHTVAEAVTAMEAGAHEVEIGANRATESGQALRDILRAADEVDRQVAEIAGAIQQTSASSGELVTAMDSVSAVVEENTAATEEMKGESGRILEAIESIASISEENSAAVEEVSASTEEVSAQIEETVASAQSLAEMADGLQTLVSQFQWSTDTTPRQERSIKFASSLNKPTAKPTGSALGNGRHVVGVRPR